MQDFPVFRPENYRAFNSRIHYSKSPQHLSSTVYSSTPPKYNSTIFFWFGRISAIFIFDKALDIASSITVFIGIKIRTWMQAV